MNERGRETGQGPKFTLDIEGALHPWDQDTITMEQIAALGGWEPQQGVIQIDKDNDERQIQPGEVVQLKPGLGFSKKIRWRRGGPVEERIDVDLTLLKGRFPSVEYRDRWVLIPSYPLPPDWSAKQTDIAFHVRDGFPGIGPYGLYAPVGLRYKGERPDRYTEPAGTQPPFGGTWGIFSWESDDWRATADPRTGHNLLNWALGATQRFREGS